MISGPLGKLTSVGSLRRYGRWPFYMLSRRHGGIIKHFRDRAEEKRQRDHWRCLCTYRKSRQRMRNILGPKIHIHTWWSKRRHPQIEWTRKEKKKLIKKIVPPFAFLVLLLFLLSSGGVMALKRSELSRSPRKKEIDRGSSIMHIMHHHISRS